MRRFQVHVRTRLDAGEPGVKRSHVEAVVAFNESLSPSFESDVCSLVETLDNVAYGTVFGTVDRKNAPSLAGIKFRDPEAAAILAAAFKKRAREAGLEAEVSTVSKSVIRASGRR
ncbi:hypothetical protein IV500_05900 [Paeniglutamicibacter antarcticus]|uniref:Uncharacterized protein n=1 Tax=Arthrobacter terrae TaxID=2935737 RepID=A0A931G3R3_9MICC|nr:hypothetical protein [Arthrobacter terrae]MBG0738956.1 hypothetical protein [Arthrobacter terrae]